MTYKTGKFTKSDKTGKDASFYHILLDGDYTPFVRCNHQTCSKIGLSKQKELKKYKLHCIIFHQVPSGESISEAISNVVQLLSNAGHTIIPISYKLNDYFKHHDIIASRLTVFDVANSAWMYRSTDQ